MIEQLEDNFQDFVEEHGVEGFIHLYFTNFLKELVEEEVRTGSDNGLSDDPGVQFYFKGNSIRDENDLVNFEDELFDECKEKAKEMVDALKKDEKFNELFSEDFEEVHSALDDDELEERFQKRFHELIGEWKKEGKE